MAKSSNKVVGMDDVSNWDHDTSGLSLKDIKKAVGNKSSKTKKAKAKTEYYPRMPKGGTPDVLKHTRNSPDKRANVSVGSQGPFYPRKNRV